MKGDSGGREKKLSINGRRHFHIIQAVVAGSELRSQNRVDKDATLHFLLERNRQTKKQNSGSLITFKGVGRASASLNASENRVAKMTTPVVCALEGSQAVGRLQCGGRLLRLPDSRIDNYLSADATRSLVSHEKYRKRNKSPPLT